MLRDEETKAIIERAIRQSSRRGFVITISQTWENGDTLYAYGRDDYGRVVLSLHPVCSHSSDFLQAVLSRACSKKMSIPEISLEFIDDIRCCRAHPQGITSLDQLVQWLRSPSPHLTPFGAIVDLVCRLSGVNAVQHGQELNEVLPLTRLGTVSNMLRRLDAREQAIDDAFQAYADKRFLQQLRERNALARRLIGRQWTCSEKRLAQVAAETRYLARAPLVIEESQAAQLYDNTGMLRSFAERSRSASDLKTPLLQIAKKKKFLRRSICSRAARELIRDKIVTKTQVRSLSSVAVEDFVDKLANSTDVCWALPEEILIEYDSSVSFEDGGLVRKEWSMHHAGGIVETEDRVVVLVDIRGRDSEGPSFLFLKHVFPWLANRLILHWLGKEFSIPELLTSNRYHFHTIKDIMGIPRDVEVGASYMRDLGHMCGPVEKELWS